MLKEPDANFKAMYRDWNGMHQRTHLCVLIRDGIAANFTDIRYLHSANMRYFILVHPNRYPIFCLNRYDRYFADMRYPISDIYNG